MRRGRSDISVARSTALRCYCVKRGQQSVNMCRHSFLTQSFSEMPRPWPFCSFTVDKTSGAKAAAVTKRPWNAFRKIHVEKRTEKKNQRTPESPGVKGKCLLMSLTVTSWSLSVTKRLFSSFRKQQLATKVIPENFTKTVNNWDTRPDQSNPVILTVPAHEKRPHLRTHEVTGASRDEDWLQLTSWRDFNFHFGIFCYFIYYSVVFLLLLKVNRIF